MSSILTDLSASGDPRSRLVLGTMNFGTREDRDTSFALLDAFVDEGGRILDSAHVYGDWDPEAGPSASERTIGEWIAARGAQDRVQVTTKIGHPALDDPLTTRLDPESLRADVEGARQNFGLETVPLVYLHRDSEEISVEDLLAPLEAFVGEGLIEAYGASNWTAARLREGREVATAQGWAGFAVDQPGWGLAQRLPATLPPGMIAMDQTLYAFHEETRLPVSPYSAQSKGYFARWTRGSDDNVVRLFDDERNREIARRLDSFSQSHDIPATELSVAVLLASPFPTLPVIGSSSVEQLRSSFRAATVELDPDELEAILGQYTVY